MSSLLNNYQLLYSQTSKLATEFSKRGDVGSESYNKMLYVLQQKFFNLIGSQPGSLYLTEKYVNAPQSSFVDEEMAKLSNLATILQITLEQFHYDGNIIQSGSLVTFNPPPGYDYVDSVDGSSQFSFSVLIPFMSPANSSTIHLTSNMLSPVNIGLQSIISSGSSEYPYVYVTVSSNPTDQYNYTMTYTLSITGISETPSITIPISEIFDHSLTICNNANGVYFLINGNDYFGPITSALAGFDITQPVTFHAVPNSVPSYKNLLIVSGYVIHL